MPDENFKNNPDPVGIGGLKNEGRNKKNPKNGGRRKIKG